MIIGSQNPVIITVNAANALSTAPNLHGSARSIAKTSYCRLTAAESKAEIRNKYTSRGETVTLASS